MNIDEAIEILAAKKKDDEERGAANSAEACQLGIEALKQVQQNRTTNLDISYKPLPGETPE